MNNRECVVMLLAGGQGSRLGGLTRDIAKPAIAYGGMYRIIDFALSNCYHSGLDTVGVLTQYKPLLLNAYIGTGSSWALDSLDGGVRILPPYVTRDGGDWYKGTADAIYQNIEYIDYYNPEYVLIISGDQVYQMDYSLMLKFHKEKKADVTISVLEVPWDQASRFGVMVTNENEQIIEFEEKPPCPTSNKASMGIYIFNWHVLKKALMEDHQLKDSNNDFGKNVLPMLLKQQKKLYAHAFQGYWRDVGTIESYYEANMDLLEEPQEFNLHEDNKHQIYTNHRNHQPHYVHEGGTTKNSLICNGCTIKGHVDHSILGYNVYVGKDSKIVDSIVLNNAYIDDGSFLENTIVGENVRIEKNMKSGIASDKQKIEVIDS